MTNIVMIMTDQQRADSLGCMGNVRARTPNIDALAARGALFLNHFTPHQICSPSRATLFTGELARHHGLTRNGVALPETYPMLSRDLQGAGYRTHGVGKFHFQPILAAAEHRMPDSNAFWELPESRDWRGPFFGFETVNILIGESVGSTEGGHYARWLAQQSPRAAALYAPENALVPGPDDMDEVWKSAIPEDLHYNTWITARACDFLKQTGNDPFFLFVSYPDPHHPFSPPAPWCDLFDPADMPDPDVCPHELDAMPSFLLDGDREEASKSYVNYLRDPGPPREQGFLQSTRRISLGSLKQAMAHTYGMVSMIDAGVGRILDQIEALGLAEDTLVVFTSDHGELLGDHGLIRKGPSPYRALLNVPLVVAGPGVTPGARDGLTSHLDLRATLNTHLGLPDVQTDGHSFAGMLADPQDQGPEAILAEYHPRTRPETYNQTILTRDWRLTTYPLNTDWGEMFDLRADPGEHRNLYFDAAHTATRQALMARLSQDLPPAPEAGGPSIATY